jgi:uncharacterized protein
MRFRFQEIFHRNEPVHVELDLDVSSLVSTHTDVLTFQPLQVRLDVQQMAGMAVARGELSNTVSFRCSRCLEPFEMPFRIPFQESFYQTEHEPDDDLDHVHPVQEDHFDLMPWIEEAFVVELPFIPVCHTECAGLCPECGTNRNVNRCKCQNRKVDPRLMGLSDWLDQHPED